MTTVCLCVGSGAVEQVLQKFEARPSDSEPQVRTAEVGAAGKARERYERSDEAVTDCGTDDYVVCLDSCQVLLHMMHFYRDLSNSF